MGNVQIECTKTDVYWVHCQICGTDGPRLEDRDEIERQQVAHMTWHQRAYDEVVPVALAKADSNLRADSTPGTVQVDDSGPEVLAHVVTPHEWLTLAQLRHWGTFLVKLADENEPSPEIDAMTGILETAAALGWQSPRAMAKALHGSGYRLERMPA